MTVFLLLFFVCPVGALAASDVPIPGMDELTDALPEDAAPILSGVSPEELPKEGVWRSLLRSAWDKVRSSAADICRMGGIMLCVCVLVSLTDTLDLGSRAPPYIAFAAVAVIGTATISDFRSYISLGTETLQTLSDYSHVLLPVLSSAAAASGAVGSAAAKYAATAVCMDVCGVYRVALADRRRYRHGGRARGAGNENDRIRRSPAGGQHSLGRGVNACRSSRYAPGNHRGFRVTGCGGDLPAAGIDARRPVSHL